MVKLDYHIEPATIFDIRCKYTVEIHHFLNMEYLSTSLLTVPLCSKNTIEAVPFPIDSISLSHIELRWGI